MEKIGVGIWGAGKAARDHLAAYLAQSDCEMAAIGSLFLDDARALADEFGIKCMLFSDYESFLRHSGIAVVSICTPHHLHPDNTIAAAQAGKHVYVEKPISVTLADLYRIRQVVRETGVRTTTGFVVRWIPLVRRIRQLVQEGALGHVRIADVDFWHSRHRPIEYRRRSTGGSAMLLGGCHAIDTAMYLMGTYPIEVFARSCQIGSEPGDEYEGDCAEVCLLRYANGAIGRVSAVVKGHVPYQFNIDLLGDLGTVRNQRVFLQDDGEQTGFRALSEEGPEYAKEFGLPYKELIRHFLDCIKRGRECETNIENAVISHEVCFAALLSDRSGRPVTLPLSFEDQQLVHQILGSESDK